MERTHFGWTAALLAVFCAAMFSGCTSPFFELGGSSASVRAPKPTAGGSVAGESEDQSTAVPGSVRQSSSVTQTYSPTFNLTVSPGSDPKALASIVGAGATVFPPAPA